MDKTTREMMSPQKRQMLQQMFQAGSKAGASGNFDYATDMYMKCVAGDPGNVLYVSSFLGNLAKKYNNNKKGGSFAGIQGVGIKGYIRKAVLQKDWQQVIDRGIEMLKLNPWDAQTLADMALACEAWGFDESQLQFLKMSLDGNLADVEMNRLAGRAFEAQGKWDDATGCWTRVLRGRADDVEARKSLANIQVKKTIDKGKYEDAQSANDVAAAKQDDRGPRFTKEQQLERQIGKDPTNLENYFDLSDLYVASGKMAEAEKVLVRALAASGGGDLTARERLEDIQLRAAREQLQVAEQKVQAEKTPANVELYNKFRAETLNKEVEYYRARVERYPQQIPYKFELASRLQRLKNFPEAIKLYQECRGDGKNKGRVLFHLGECFFQIKQPKLAMANFDAALVELEREPDLRKRCLYNAGVTARALQDWDAAERHFSELAGIDFGYLDVSDQLAKLAEVRHKG